MKFAEEYYLNNIKQVKDELSSLEKILNRYAALRLAIAIAAIISTYYCYKKDNFTLVVVSIAFGITAFLIAAFFHNNKINEKNKKLLLLKYNEKGIMRINGEWKKFDDYGKEYIDKKHNFTNDLDIFGKNSLFQWINITNSQFGRNILAKMLRLDNIPSINEVKNNQEAIKELKDKRELCQNIYLETCNDKYSDKNIDRFIQWMKGDKVISLTPKYIPYLFLTVTYTILFFTIIRKIPISVLVLDLLINYLVIKVITRQTEEIVGLVLNNKRKIIQYTNVLAIIQKEEYISKKLNTLKGKLVSARKNSVEEMGKLKNIINWLGDSTGNAYYLILNLFMMSDIFILHNLELWRKENGQDVEEWLNIMGEFEALISLSNLAFEHELWNYPDVTDDFKIEAIEIGHPLLGERAKVNDFKLCGGEKAALITGSNMSGKSTFLRTIGFNMILAYLGVPVFAKDFKCGIFNIYTCMRTQDDLEENISSFYAEILRIKLVIEAAKKGEKVFFLLDEIFKGTNSKDRHHGAQVLIEQLVAANGRGLVSTHDLELCDLEKVHPWLVNYNFQEYYKDNKIKFDYKLRKGKSTTQNAKYLMKMAGIDME